MIALGVKQCVRCITRQPSGSLNYRPSPFSSAGPDVTADGSPAAVPAGRCTGPARTGFGSMRAGQSMQPGAAPSPGPLGEGTPIQSK